MTVQDVLTAGSGRFYRGNLHCHSTRSDGVRTPEEVVGAYRTAGYDFIGLSDHFEAEYGWTVTDTRALRDAAFTTILTAELSSADWSHRHTFWVAAVGLPPDFTAPQDQADHAEAIERARDAGAFVVLLHPALNDLPLEATRRLPAFDAIHAVEIYTHGMAAICPDRVHGAHWLDGLLERGQRLLAHAGDDAHFKYPRDRFGAWIEVHAPTLDPEALLASLKAGRYYSTTGPALCRMVIDGGALHVTTSDAYAIVLSGGGDRWQSTARRVATAGQPVNEATFDLTPFRGSYCRVTVLDHQGRRAWGNPVWP
jgi:predicted metal-dependent phosphoesterase TrpH